MNATTNTTPVKMNLADAAARTAELKKQLDAIQGVFPELAKRTNLEIKIGEKGYLYITDPSFKAVSKAGKNYVAGLNMNVDVAKTLFNNDEILGKIRSFLATDMTTPVNEFNLTA